MSPAGLEPATRRSRVGCSAAELRRRDRRAAPGAGGRRPRGWSRTTHLRLIRAALSPLSYTRGLPGCVVEPGRFELPPSQCKCGVLPVRRWPRRDGGTRTPVAGFGDRCLGRLATSLGGGRRLRTAAPGVVHELRALRWARSARTTAVRCSSVCGGQGLDSSGRRSRVLSLFPMHRLAMSTPSRRRQRLVCRARVAGRAASCCSCMRSSDSLP